MIKEKSGNIEKALKYAYWLIGRRNHSEKEMRQKLGRNYNSGVVEPVIEKLKLQKVINDDLFAKEWAEYRLKQNKSKNFVMSELSRKGISRKTAQDIFSEMNIDESANAYNSVERKIRQYAKLEPFKKKNKILRFLASKGFDFDVIEQVTQKLMESDKSEED